MWHLTIPYVSHFLLQEAPIQNVSSIFLWQLSSRCYTGSLVTKLQIPCFSLGNKSLKFRIAFHTHYWDLQSLLTIQGLIKQLIPGSRGNAKPQGFWKRNIIQSSSQGKPDSRPRLYCWKSANQLYFSCDWIGKNKSQ